ncbi:MAG TPA: VTT domain-containing protein [Planctomycetota bacterium]|nr:VTT domain-containing protein [Planctomycetota bacterium]
MAASRRTWIEAGILLAVLIALAAAWKWTPLGEWANPARLGAALEPYGNRWVGLPLVVGVFVVAELLMFPVVVLIFMCGLAFGPWIGALYALVGVVVSAIPPFLLGRKLGRRRVERLGGAPVSKLVSLLQRKGLVAVFVVRKIPAPYSLVNLVCGACGLKLVDFIWGTMLGMAAGVIIITVLGTGLRQVLTHPQPAQLVLLACVVAATGTTTMLLQRRLNRRAGRSS